MLKRIMLTVKFLRLTRKVAAVLTNPIKESSDFAALIRNLIENQSKKERTLQRTAHFYCKIGYDGCFVRFVLFWL